MQDPHFTIGIEEEYLLVDKDSLDLAQAPQELMDEAASVLEGQASPEFLKCQIEIGTRVCGDMVTARDDLRKLRRTVSELADKYGLAPMAASCHPFSDWKDQVHTDKARYNALQRDLGGVASRLLICGMHVHVGIEDNALRIDLMRQMSYFLPHLLALSTSSPFWQGRDTGLASYRLTVFDNLPRTGMPPQFESWSDYERSVSVLTDLNIIEDSSKIWWDLRPSARFPTLETRIMDVPSRLSHALSLTALNRCLLRMLWRLRVNNQRWRIYDRFLLSENRWRAQRYGVSEGLIDFGRGEILSFETLIEELISLIAEDAEALGCMREVEAVREIVTTGTSADRQRQAYQAALANGNDTQEALRAVVRSLIDDYHYDL